MIVRINAPKKFLAGLIYVSSGITIFVAARNYEIGTAMAMGPGYFPSLLGIVLAGIGAISIYQGIGAKIYEAIPKHSIEPLILILASIISFSLLIERAGLIVATFVCLFFACFRRVFSHPIEFLAIFGTLTTFTLIVFVYLFQLAIPLFWWG